MTPSPHVFSVIGVATQVHIVRYGLDRDLSRRRAESLLLYLGAGALTMRVPVGALADRCGRSRVYSAVCLTYAVALASYGVETLRHRADVGRPKF